MQSSTQAFLCFLQTVFDTSTHCDTCPKLPNDIYINIQNNDSAEIVVKEMLIRFLSDNNNLNGISGLSCSSMSQQPSVLKVGETTYCINVRDILASARAIPQIYARLWRDLISMCHTVTPSPTQFAAQLAEIDKQMGCVVQGAAKGTAKPSYTIADLLGRVLEPIQGIIQDDISQLNPSMLVTTIGQAIEPLVDSLQDGEYKAAVQQVMKGLATLSQKQ